MTEPYDPHYRRSDNLTDLQREQIAEHEDARKPPHKARFKIGNLAITSLVIDQDEFNALCYEFLGLFPEMTEEMVHRLIKTKHVPMIAKGTKTAKFFDRYGIKTERMSIIVRGAGSEVIAKTLEDARLKLESN
jgi:hypothetical protein